LRCTECGAREADFGVTGTLTTGNAINLFDFGDRLLGDLGDGLLGDLAS
jgi:hypothetical protein